jgi:hypothetical protein
MITSELRLGNFVTDEFYESFKTIVKVESINDKGINLEIEDDGNYPECAARWIEPYNRTDTLRPIPLTEEWLLKFGFQKLKQNIYIKYNSDIDFSLAIYVRQECCDWSINGYTISTIKYVHQLQNLFFAMSNEELQLSST